MIVAVIQMVPGESYKKYIRFFAGLILIFMLAGPIFKIFGVTGFHDEEYQKELEKIEEAAAYFENMVGEEDAFGNPEE